MLLLQFIIFKNLQEIADIAGQQEGGFHKDRMGIL